MDLPQLTPKEYNFSNVIGISQKTLAIHYNKLYKGYVAKANEINEKLRVFGLGGGDVETVNPSYHELRALRDAETFVRNAVYLHEHYFDILGGDGVPGGTLKSAIIEKWGNYENFERYYQASCMVARGWLILAWNRNDQKLNIFMSDGHAQGGVWSCEPVLVFDAYEHAYFIDYGADRKAYVKDFFKNLNWDMLDKKFKKTHG
ncbi:MAG: superoxide dismutase [Candidatus Magasanikbacteria bacterium]|nr:superoxide dismutase [Candidatus Magasanikbacteria bacterium]